MKIRIISAIIATLIFLPIFIIGGTVFNVAVYILTILGIREFIKAREKNHTYPNFIKAIVYFITTFLYLSLILKSDLKFDFNYQLLCGTFLVLLLPVVLYHDDKTYSVNDAFYLIGGILFLTFAMSLLGMYRNLFGLSTIVFLFLITITTDSYAYFVGRLIGRHKLLEVISPNKTWEGTIGGSVMGTFICTMYYLTVINSSASILRVIVVVFFLTLVGQFGDLFFSAIKRKYGIKDFSNIMPGHGGVLDRLDSIVFVMITFTFFLNII